MEAGAELDALVAEKVMGLNLVEPREFAMARVAWRHILATGTDFIVDVDGHHLRIAVPMGETLRMPQGSDYFNDRYALYIAEQLGDRIAKEVDEYRSAAKPYSTDIAAAWSVVEKCVSDGMVFIVKGDGLRTGDFNPKWTVLCGNQERTDADTAPLAICLAALKAAGA